jgi:hypothetical protein
MLSTAGPSCPTCGASIEPGTHLYSEIANSSWHRLCWKHTTSTEMHLTIVWFNHELFKHVDAKHRCTAIICQMLLKKRKDLYYICCTEEEKGPLLYLLYWRRERTFTTFVVLKKRKDLYYICCTEEEKGPLLYLLYWRRERTFTTFVVLKKRKDLYYICCTSKIKDLYYICCTSNISDHELCSEIWDILIEWLNDWFEVALHNESHRISETWLPVIAINDIKVYKKYQIDDVYLLSVMQHVYYIKMCQIIYDFVLLFYR